MFYEEASRKIENYVTTFFQEHPREMLLYHNLNHTREVVSHTREIAAFYELNDESLFIVTTSAWFHDIGYVFSGPENHELLGAWIMEEYALKQGFSRDDIEKIGRCIMATKRFAHPSSLLEKILCDSDTYHFGTLEFRKTDLMVQREVELLTGTFTNGWVEKAIEMLKAHQFYTFYCQQKLDEGKLQNIAWLESRLNESRAYE